MEALIRSLWRLPRDLVSDGYDEALDALSSEIPMTIHEYPTGTECFTWIIPEKWTCNSARLENLAGDVLISYKDNPLHVVSYSLPFNGIVDRETLLGHLYTREDIPNAIPFVFKYYNKDWGLCCAHELKETLTDDRYKVVIDTTLSPGNLKVGEVLIEGRSKDCYVFCAHLCHPGQTNDDMVGVALGLEVFKKLLEGPKPKFSYRLIILPETIGSAAWLSHNEHLIPRIKGGLFLEMLGTRYPHALQKSNTPESQIDKICELLVRKNDEKAWIADFMKVILNDERMFNAPGINIPMLSLSRVLKRKHLHIPPYFEYHTSLDTPDSIDWANLERSKVLVMDIVKAIEINCIPKPLFKGELFCSRYGKIDYSAMFDVMNAVVYKLDGNRSIADIAHETGYSFFEIADFIQILHDENLIEYTPLTSDAL